MAAITGISWADSTVNLWTGCTKVSRACDHCYAETLMDTRFGRVAWGPHGDRQYVKAGWALARRLQRAAAANRGLDPELGRRRRVFVNSLSDFFDNHRSIVWRGDAWALFRSCPDVDFMLLTKRPQNIAKMLPPDWDAAGWPNVWLGVTVEDQIEAVRRIPYLLAVPGRVIRFLSCEPLLSFVQPWLPAIRDRAVELGADPDNLPGLDWVIAGGESGNGARSMDLTWPLALLELCRLTGTAFHFKQLSEADTPRYEDPEAFPEALRVREFPEAVL